MPLRRIFLLNFIFIEIDHHHHKVNNTTAQKRDERPDQRVIRQTHVIDVNTCKHSFDLMQKLLHSECVLLTQTSPVILLHIRWVAWKRNIPKNLSCQHVSKSRTFLSFLLVHFWHFLKYFHWYGHAIFICSRETFVAYNKGKNASLELCDVCGTQNDMLSAMCVYFSTAFP